MIYIDYPLNICACLICTSLGKPACDCTKLYVYINEGLLFSIEHKMTIKRINLGAADELLTENDALWLKKYRAKKKVLYTMLQNKFPLAKEIFLYPHSQTQFNNSKYKKQK